jgi:cell division protein FtsB
VINIKSAAREEFTIQISALRKENSALKTTNNDLLLKIEYLEKNTPQQTAYQNFDW